MLASTVTANAADSTPSAGSSAAVTESGSSSSATVDQSKSQRSDEHLLTGTDAEKARAAVLAK